MFCHHFFNRLSCLLCFFIWVESCFLFFAFFLMGLSRLSYTENNHTAEKKCHHNHINHSVSALIYGFEGDFFIFSQRISVIVNEILGNSTGVFRIILKNIFPLTYCFYLCGIHQNQGILRIFLIICNNRRKFFPRRICDFKRISVSFL